MMASEETLARVASSKEEQQDAAWEKFEDGRTRVESVLSTEFAHLNLLVFGKDKKSEMLTATRDALVTLSANALILDSLQREKARDVFDHNTQIPAERPRRF